MRESAAARYAHVDLTSRIASAGPHELVTILYDRGGDTYVVELHRQNGESVELVDRHDEVYFDMLGEVLERLIDDGRWRQIDVSILDAKAARKRQAVPA